MIDVKAKVKPIENEKNRTSRFAYVALFLILLLSSGFAIGYILGGTVTLILTFFVAFGVIVSGKKLLFDRTLLQALMIAVVAGFINAALTDQNFSTFIIFLAEILVAFALVHAYKEDLVVCLCKLMYFLAFFSLMMWIAYIIMPGVVALLPVIENARGYKAYTALFSTIGASSNMIFSRNQGIFWEPGAYQTFINIALMCTLFLNEFKETRRRYSVVFVATIITTFSTTGYIVCLAILLVYFIKEITETKSVSRLTKVAFIASVAFLIFAVIYNYLPESAKHQLFGKLDSYFEDETSEAGGSTYVRMEAIKIAFMQFINHPILGAGVNSVTEAGEYIGGMLTCTPLNWFAYYGIFFGVICTFGFYKLTRLFSERKSIRFLLFICFMLTMLSENYWRNPCILMLVLLGWFLKKRTQGEIEYDGCRNQLS